MGFIDEIRAGSYIVYEEGEIRSFAHKSLCRLCICACDCVFVFATKWKP